MLTIEELGNINATTIFNGLKTSYNNMDCIEFKKFYELSSYLNIDSFNELIDLLVTAPNVAFAFDLLIRELI